MKRLSPVIPLILLVAFAWRNILFGSFLGEGYYYFTERFFGQKVFLGDDQGARLLFEILIKLFSDNVFLYNCFLFISLISLVVCFYYVILKLTNNRSVSLMASILFGINFYSLFELFGSGAYQDFAQRPLWFLILFPSFTLYFAYLNTNKIKFAIISLLLYVVSLYFAEFTIFFLPYFISYFIGFLLFRKKRKVRPHNVLATSFYIVLTLAMLNLDAHFSSDYARSALNGHILQFVITKRVEIANLVVRQLVILTIPAQITHQLISNMQVSYFKGVTNFYLPILVLYASTAIYLIKKGFGPLVICILLALLMVFIFNIYEHEDYMLAATEGGRYMFVPSIGFAIFWALFLDTFFKDKLRFIPVFILIYWIFMNSVLIQRGISEYESRFKGTQVSLAYIKSASSHFSKGSIVIVPSVLGYWGSYYAQLFYGNKTMFFAPYFSDWPNQIDRPINTKKDFILRYDYSLNKVVDDTTKFDQIVQRRKNGIVDVPW